MATVAVRMNDLTKSKLDDLVIKINKARSKHKKIPLTIAQVIDVAIQNLNVEMGVSK